MLEWLADDTFALALFGAFDGRPYGAGADRSIAVPRTA
jgi:hypothetical protein